MRLVYTQEKPTVPGRYRCRQDGIKKTNLHVIVYEELGQLQGLFLDKDGSLMGLMSIDKIDPTSEWARVGGII